VVTKRDVSELEGEDRSQVLFVRQYIDQPSAERGRVAHRERLKRRGYQDAAVNCLRQVKVISNDEVIRNCFQHFVEVPGRRQYPCLYQPVEHVRFCLRDPGPAGLQGTYILRPHHSCQ
jgi:hypothetical protein